MLLLAVAVVFIGLGWHSAATAGDNPQSDLASAGQSTPPASTVSSSAPSSAASASAVRLCVFNAGSVSGLASEVTDELKAKGYRTAAPGNIESSSITENTVFYDDDTQSEAEKVAKDLSGDASVDPRPSSFTQCRDGIPVIVVTR